MLRQSGLASPTGTMHNCIVSMSGLAATLSLPMEAGSRSTPPGPPAHAALHDLQRRVKALEDKASCDAHYFAEVCRYNRWAVAHNLNNYQTMACRSNAPPEHFERVEDVPLTDSEMSTQPDVGNLPECVDVRRLDETMAAPCHREHVPLLPQEPEQENSPSPLRCSSPGGRTPFVDIANTLMPKTLHFRGDLFESKPNVCSGGPREVPHIDYQEVTKLNPVVENVAEGPMASKQVPAVPIPAAFDAEAVGLLPEPIVHQAAKQIPEIVLDFEVQERVQEAPQVLVQDRTMEVPEARRAELLREAPRGAYQEVTEQSPERGFKPVEQAVDLPVPQSAEETDEVSKVILQIVQRLRELCEQTCSDKRLRSIFEMYDIDNSASLSMDEVHMILIDLGLAGSSDTKHEAQVNQQLVEIFEETNNDGNATIECNEFPHEHVLQRVVEQIVDVPVPHVGTEVKEKQVPCVSDRDHVEVPEILPQERARQRTVEQVVDTPVLQVQQETNVEAPQVHTGDVFTEHPGAAKIAAWNDKCKNRRRGHTSSSPRVAQACAMTQCP